MYLSDRSIKNLLKYQYNTLFCKFRKIYIITVDLTDNSIIVLYKSRDCH